MLHRRKSIVDRGHNLGILSSALGLFEILLPDKVASTLGIPDSSSTRGVIRMLGVREVAHGLSLLNNFERDTTDVSLWGRVAGDVLDTALFAGAATQTNRPGRFAAIAAVLALISYVDFQTASQASEQRHFFGSSR